MTSRSLLAIALLVVSLTLGAVSSAAAADRYPRLRSAVLTRADDGTHAVLKLRTRFASEDAGDRVIVLRASGRRPIEAEQRPSGRWTISADTPGAKAFIHRLARRVRRDKPAGFEAGVFPEGSEAVAVAFFEIEGFGVPARAHYGTP